MTDHRKQEYLRSLKFLIFSISAGVIQILSFTLMNELLGGWWGYWPSYLISLILSVLWNFTFNRRFTFKSAANVPVAMLKVFAFYAVFTPLSTLLGDYLVKTLLWNEYLVTAMNMVVNLITEFLYQRFFVFNQTLDTNELAQKETTKQRYGTDIYDDEKKISGAVNHVAAWVFLGSRVGKEFRFKVGKFTGVKTIGQFRLDLDKSETFRIVFKVTEGKAKLVLVNEIGMKTLVENTFEGEKSVFLLKGMTRVRLVGSHASFELTMERLP